MARTGRPRGKKFDTYLPQTACTEDLYEQVKHLADEKYEGNIGALIRASVQEKITREKLNSN